MVKKDRLLSLDFLRGLVIILMIIVNSVVSSTGSEAYSFLKHSVWNGWTLADMVFPFFLWIIGVSMVFSFAKRMKKGEDKKKIMRHVAKRAVILFLFGFLFNLLVSFSFANFRILGVLQLIAITYFFAGIIILFTKPKTQMIFMIVLLLASGLLLKFVMVPGQEIGVLEPGKNLANYIDIQILGKQHMLHENYDCEGLFNCFSAITTVLFGAFVGCFLNSRRKDAKKIIGIGLLGILLIITGSILDIWLPINKNLWTSSFSIFMSGLACLVFVISFWIIDFKKYQKFTFPFVVFGLNALSLYITSGIIYELFLIKFYKGMNLYLFFYEKISQILPLKVASLMVSVTQVLIIYFIAYFMYKKKIFLKI